MMGFGLLNSCHQMEYIDIFIFQLYLILDKLNFISLLIAEIYSPMYISKDLECITIKVSEMRWWSDLFMLIINMS